MPTSNKDKYTDKQKKKAAHIEDSYEAKGVSKRAVATQHGVPTDARVL